jgi:riboflavin kinase / FMN hydrolase
MEPLLLEGTVVKGFGRGSKQLGVPTANVEMTEQNKEKTQDLVPGVYAAQATLNGKSYRCAMSIGWNPVYDNAEKTIEAFLINNFDKDDYDFYGAHLQLNVIAFIRAESLFSDFDSLIQAIQCDIHSVINSKLFF